MIGIDIVDLELARINSRWKEQRFLDKLFTIDEQTFLGNDESQYQNIWRLWSMKESAYKIYSRTFTTSIFNPKSFICAISSDKTGTVCFEGQQVITTTDYNLNNIYTVAKLPNTQYLKEMAVLEGSEKEKGLQLKDKAIQVFADMKSVSNDSISIVKNHIGRPQLYLNHELQDNVLTLTHHGNYGGFAISF